MVAKIALSWVNQIDASATTLSASSTAGDLSISNIATPIIGRRWRTTSMTAYGLADFGSDKTIGLLALVFPRDTAFPTTGTITHALDADGGTPGSGAVLDEAVNINATNGPVAGYGYHVYKLATPVSARYWRFTFDVSGVPFIDVGRAWAGDAWQPDLNIAFGYGDEWGDLSRVSRSTRSGAEFIDERPRQRAFAYSLEALSAGERDDLREMQRIIGISKQLLFVKDPDSPATETVIGRIDQSTPLLQPYFSLSSKAFTVRESL